jgi:hypothetical protein
MFQLPVRAANHPGRVDSEARQVGQLEWVVALIS